MGKFGGEIFVGVTSLGTYNAADGTVRQTVTESQVRGLLEDVRTNEVGGLIENGDKRLTIAAADVASAPTPKTTKITTGGKTWRVIEVRTTENDNDPIIYELIIRS